MSENVSLSKRRLAAATLLAGGHSKAAVGAAVGVTARTIQRWRNEDEAFATALLEMQQEIIDESLRVLKANAAQAARVLQETLDNINDTAGGRESQAIDWLVGVARGA
jgi:transposase